MAYPPGYRPPQQAYQRPGMGALNSQNYPPAYPPGNGAPMQQVPAQSYPPAYPMPAAALENVPAQSQDMWRQVWFHALDPVDQARIAAYAQSVGKKLNFNRPLEAQILTDQFLDVDAEDLTAPAFDVGSLEYKFPAYGYILRSTCTVLPLSFVEGYAPDVLFTGATRAEQFILGKFRRTTPTTFTAGGDDGFIPLSEWTGWGGDPYRFDLIQFFLQADTLNVDIRLTSQVQFAARIQLSFHILHLPVIDV